MPERTIDNAFFDFRNEKGLRVHAVRGETVDIPEGDDLERGDKWGAFTAEPGLEPEAPEGSFIPDIEVNWSQAEFKRWVDSGKVKEILEKLDAVAPSDRSSVASRLIEAEHTRNDKARPSLLKSLAVVASSGQSVEPDVVAASKELSHDPNATTQDEEEVKASHESGADFSDDDLDEFVATSTIAQVLERANEEPSLREALLAAEQARGDKARVGVIEPLSKPEA